MPRPKIRGGYKGPVPGPKAGGDGGERSQQQQKPAKKPPLTHFLCLPLVTTESKPLLEASLKTFKDDVLNPGAGGGIGEQGQGQATIEGGVPINVGRKPLIPAKAIRPVGTLHLTLGVMSLMSPERVQEAIELLQCLDLKALLLGQPQGPESKSTTEGSDQPGNRSENIVSASSPHSAAAPGSAAASDPAQEVSELNSDPLLVTLKSLVSMHPPAKTSILYAHPDDSTDRLHPFCNSLRTLFTEKGLMVEDTRPLKLHATIVNTIYAKAGGRHGKGRGKGWQDAQKKSASEAQPQAEDNTTEPGQSQEVPDRSEGHGPNARAPIRIDATSLLPQYADFVWADEIKIGKVAICKMGAKKIVDASGAVIGEEYEEVASAQISL